MPKRQTEEGRRTAARFQSPTHTSTLTTAKAGAVMRRLGVVRIRSLRTMSCRRFYGCMRRNKRRISHLSRAGTPRYTHTSGEALISCFSILFHFHWFSIIVPPCAKIAKVSTFYGLFFFLNQFLMQNTDTNPAIIKDIQFIQSDFKIKGS